MSDTRNYYHRRFGPIFAQRFLNWWCVVVVTMLLAIPAADFMLAGNDPAWADALGHHRDIVRRHALVWRMYRTGPLKFARIGTGLGKSAEIKRQIA